MLCALMGFGAVGFAQDKGKGNMPERGDYAKSSAERLKKELNLSDAQYEKVYALKMKEVEDMKKLNEKRKALEEEGKALRESSNTKVTAELNAEQKAKYEDLMSKRSERMAERIKQRRGPGQRAPRNMPRN